MSNEVALIPYSEVRAMAVDIHKSGMFNLKTPEAAMALMMLAQAEGLHPVQALRRFHVLHDGRTSMRADAMLAGYRSKGGKVRWSTRADDKSAQMGVWTFEGQEIEIGFTLAEATAAGYTSANPKPGSGWQRDPAAMLRARAISRAIRMLTPEVVVGIYTPEEMEDIPANENGGILATSGAKAPKAGKAAPDVQAATVVGSEPLKGAQAPAAAASAPADADPEEKAAEKAEGEAGRRRYLRGKLNQALLGIKDDAKAFQKLRVDFGKTHGTIFEKMATEFKDGETYESLMGEHWKRVGPAYGARVWREQLKAAPDIEVFRKLEKAFLDKQVDNGEENAAVLQAAGSKWDPELYGAAEEGVQS